MSNEKSSSFISALGFSRATLHSPLEHFDFRQEGRIFMVLGPMGSGKTQFAAQVWRESLLINKKSSQILKQIQTSYGAKRTDVFFIRSRLDSSRFQDNPKDSLSYRGGYERLGKNIAYAKDSYEIEELIEKNPSKGLWIIDEPAFYDERLVYLVERMAKERKLTFILTGIVLDFRRNIFNTTTQLFLEIVTDVVPLTSYCEHPDCLEKAIFTHRFYKIEDREVPALFFDPLILIGGDIIKNSPLEPNYESRCASHHYLVGKEYTYCTLIPLARGAREEVGIKELKKEMFHLKESKEASLFYQSLIDYNKSINQDLDIQFLLKMPYLAERALQYIFQEQNILSLDLFKNLVEELKLDKTYLNQVLQGSFKF